MSNPSFKNLFHSSQTDSGLIPPKSSNAWPERDAPALSKPIWTNSELKPEPTPPTREERKTEARRDAIVCIETPGVDNKNLALILKIKYGITEQEAVQIVKEAQAAIECGGKDIT
jgi:hypothetical protein